MLKQLAVLLMISVLATIALATETTQTKKFRKEIRAERGGDVYNLYFVKDGDKAVVTQPENAPTEEKSILAAPESASAEASVAADLEDSKPLEPLTYKVYLAPVATGADMSGGELGIEKRFSTRFSLSLGVSGLHERGMHGGDSDKKVQISGTHGAGANLLAHYAPWAWEHNKSRELRIAFGLGVGYYSLQKETKTKVTNGNVLEEKKETETGPQVLSPIGSLAITYQFHRRFSIDGIIRGGGHPTLNQVGLGAGVYF